MREARLIFIVGHSAARTIAMANVISSFGGATVTDGIGYWKGDAENVEVVDIAYEQTNENDLKLYDIADHYRLNAEQEAVYLRYGSGHVQMVTAQSCMDNGMEWDWEKFRELLHRPADEMSDIVGVS